jgi:hypothetical protein
LILSAVLAYFPNFSADRNIPLRERLVHRKAQFPIARPEKVETVERSLDYSAIRSSQFEVIALFQARLASHCKRHRWSEVKRSILQLEYVGNNDEQVHGDAILAHC